MSPPHAALQLLKQRACQTPEPLRRWNRPKNQGSGSGMKPLPRYSVFLDGQARHGVRRPVKQSRHARAGVGAGDSAWRIHDCNVLAASLRFAALLHTHTRRAEHDHGWTK